MPRYEADQVIEKTIIALCRKLEYTRPGGSQFLEIVEAISKLRASLNPVIQQIQPNEDLG